MYPSQSGTAGWSSVAFATAVDPCAKDALPSLYVADAKTGAVTLKPVAVKAYGSNDVLIMGGVDEGANVIALGVQKLDPAEKVKVVSSLSF